jgi:hypothetical protein
MQPPEARRLCGHVRAVINVRLDGPDGEVHTEEVDSKNFGDSCAFSVANAAVLSIMQIGLTVEMDHSMGVGTYIPPARFYDIWIVAHEEEH